MKKLQHLHSFESYIASKQVQDDLNEANFKTLALAGLMGASALSASGAGNKGGDKVKSEFSTHNPTTAKNKIEREGYTLDSTVTIKKLLSMPTNIIDTINYTIPIANDFESSKFDLTQVTKNAISEALNDIEVNGYDILYMNIISSSDATPISARMTSQTGIKNNIELSLKRSASVSNYLKNYIGADSCLINVEKPIVGDKPDSEKDRYVTLEIVTTKIVEKNIGGKDSEETTYYLSKDKNNVGVKKKSHYFVKETKRASKSKIITDLKSIPCNKIK